MRESFWCRKIGINSTQSDAGTKKLSLTCHLLWPAMTSMLAWHKKWQYNFCVILTGFQCFAFFSLSRIQTKVEGMLKETPSIGEKEAQGPTGLGLTPFWRLLRIAQWALPIIEQLCWRIICFNAWVTYYNDHWIEYILSVFFCFCFWKIWRHSQSRHWATSPVKSLFPVTNLPCCQCLTLATVDRTLACSLLTTCDSYVGGPLSRSHWRSLQPY